MDVHRIEGIKYDLDRLTDAELANIRNNLVEQHARVTGEIALLEFKLFARKHDPLPMEDEYINGYAEIADGRLREDI